MKPWLSCSLASLDTTGSYRAPNCSQSLALRAASLFLFSFPSPSPVLPVQLFLFSFSLTSGATSLMRAAQVSSGEGTNRHLFCCCTLGYCPIKNYHVLLQRETTRALDAINDFTVVVSMSAKGEQWGTKSVFCSYLLALFMAMINGVSPGRHSRASEITSLVCDQQLLIIHHKQHLRQGRGWEAHLWLVHWNCLQGGNIFSGLVFAFFGLTASWSHVNKKKRLVANKKNGIDVHCWLISDLT